MTARGRKTLHKKYILFGAGSYGKRLLQWFGKNEIVYFCDNSNKQSSVDGVEIIQYKKLKEVHKDYHIVLAVERNDYAAEIANQLNADDIPFISFEDAAGKYINEIELPVYESMNKRPTFQYDSSCSRFAIQDRFSAAGGVHSYFWQDLWAAKHIFEKKPEYHYDIGSRIDGFIAHLSTFGQKVRLLDIRPLGYEIPNVDFVQCDATNLDTIADNSIESLSALCSLEHFGLGRYGDPIDPEACFKCFVAIQKKVKPGGFAYIAVPVGREHLEWHVHRVFNASTIVASFDEMSLVEYSTTSEGKIEYNTNLHKYDAHPQYGGECFGLFMLKKK